MPSAPCSRSGPPSAANGLEVGDRVVVLMPRGPDNAAVLMAALGAIWGFGYIAGGVLCILAIGAAMRPKGTIWLWLVVVAVGLPLATFYLTWHGLRLSLP